MQHRSFAQGDLLAVADPDRRCPSGIDDAAASVSLRGDKLVFSADGHLLAVANGREFALWDVQSERILIENVSSRDEPDPSYNGGPYGGINVLDFSPDGKLLAIGLDDGSIRFRNVPTGTLRDTLKGHASGIRLSSLSSVRTNTGLCR